LITACVLTLDPLFCDLTPRTSSGQLGVVDNQLRNIGGIEESGFDFAVTSPETGIGRFIARLNATYLNEYKEFTANIDETVTETDDSSRKLRLPQQRRLAGVGKLSEIERLLSSAPWPSGRCQDGQ
jgi:hypothetical protein